MSRQLRTKEFMALLAMLVAVVCFWNTQVVYPLQLLVVFFHELSHGLAATATGGSISEIQLASAVGGSCTTLGGSRFLILSAGYLGSLVWGGLILVIATRTSMDRLLMACLGVILVATTAFFVRPIDSFGFGFGMATGAVMLLLGLFFPGAASDFILKIVGLTSCLYAILDIKSDILDRPGSVSDAFMLSELTGVPTVVWGVAWIATAAVASWYFLILACRPPHHA